MTRGRDVHGAPTELACEATIIAVAIAAGWLVHGSRTVRVGAGARAFATPNKGQSGFPDLVLIHPGRRELLVIELKHGKNSTTAEQDVWLEGFRACGVQTGVFKVPEQQKVLEDYLTRRPSTRSADKG